MYYFFISILCSLLLLSNVLEAKTALWTEVNLAQRHVGQSLFKSMPDRYSLYQLDEVAMRIAMKTALTRVNTAARQQNAVTNTLAIPLPNKAMIELQLTETTVMAAALAAKYPQLRTYKAHVVGRPLIQGVVDLNALGFHGMLFMEDGQRLFIDPRRSANGEVYYISYYDKDYHPSDKIKPQCQVDNSASKNTPLARIHSSDKTLPLQRTGTQLRTYRLAMAATGEYTTYFGGTVAQGLSAITTTIARVNQILERDLAVTLQLIADNDQIVFTNAATDPYLDTSSSALIAQNQETIDSIIGNANYDIGHVFSQSFGGLAQFEAVCFDNVKAEAMTGLLQPENDPFDIDFVAHEIGHQLGGNHSFNAQIDGCNARNAATAWEIGNGITIMGYADICAESNNVLTNSIAMFHIGNIEQMSTFINNANAGSFCGT